MTEDHRIDGYKACWEAIKREKKHSKKSERSLHHKRNGLQNAGSHVPRGLTNDEDVYPISETTGNGISF